MCVWVCKLKIYRYARVHFVTDVRVCENVLLYKNVFVKGASVRCLCKHVIRHTDLNMSWVDPCWVDMCVCVCVCVCVQMSS